MRKALYILSQLNDDDVEWIADHGTRRQLKDGETIIYEGKPVDALFITLVGRLKVAVLNGREVARLSVGEIVGEIAFIDSSPPSATVTAVGDAIVLALPKSLLQRRLASDHAFAARFYRALAIFLADRLRATTQQLGYGSTGDFERETTLKDELDATLLDTVSHAGDRFTRLVRRLSDHEAKHHQ
jgi:CRP/FNR family transcriptional regulator, cyclic AMP receptor protein